jgi:uncharacterized protein
LAGFFLLLDPAVVDTGPRNLRHRPRRSTSDKLQEWIVEVLAIPRHDTAFLFTDAAVLERQAAAVSGSYWDNVLSMWEVTWNEWLLGGVMIAWVVYALGRFALGAAIGRSGHT